MTASEREHREIIHAMMDEMRRHPGWVSGMHIVENADDATITVYTPGRLSILATGKIGGPITYHAPWQEGFVP